MSPRGTWARDANTHPVEEIDTGITAAVRRSALVFPGLGGEIFNRCIEITAASESFRHILARADVISAARLGKTVSELIRLYAANDSEASRMRRLFRPAAAATTIPTAAAHTILYTMECALAYTWLEWGLRPQCVMGYSLGEYSAAWVAGLFSLEAGLTLLIERAELLAGLGASGMFVVGAGLEALAPVMEPGLHVVAVNSNSHTVMGGERESLDRVARRLRTLGHVVHELPVEHAFHTPLMQPAAAKLAESFAKIETCMPTLPLVSTLTGGLIEPRQLREPEHWRRHLCEPVQFRHALQTLVSLGNEVLLEVGPGQALSGLMESHLGKSTPVTVVASMPVEHDERPALAHLLRTATQLRELGLPVYDTPTSAVPGPLPAPMPRAPVTPDEQTLQAIQRIWAEALGAIAVNSDANLLDLGCDSLKAARIVLRIRQELNVELSLRDIYTAATPRRLTQIIGVGRRIVAAADLYYLPNGLTIQCQSPAEAEYFYQSIFAARSYLKHGLHIPPGATVVDVGANIGIFSMFAALEAPGARLYSFEPVGPLFEMLRFNLADLTEEAHLFNIGLSETRGQSVITYYPNSPGMSSIEADRAEEEAVLAAILRNSGATGGSQVEAILRDGRDFMDARFMAQPLPCPLMTLSEVIEEHELAQIDFLKIDVQKHELKVLRGIAAHHWSRIRQAAIEIHDRDGRVEEVRSLFGAHGFRVHVEQERPYEGTEIYNLYALR